MSQVTAIGILDAAAQHQRDRASTYDSGSGERSAAAVATAFNAITGRAGDRALSESEAWLFLQVLKQVRLFKAPGYHADSAEDNVAYGSLLAESKARETATPLVFPTMPCDCTIVCVDTPAPGRHCMRNRSESA